MQHTEGDYYAIEMVEAEVRANVLRLQDVVKKLTCEYAGKTREELAAMAKGNDLALVAMLQVQQVRDAVLEFQPKLRFIVKGQTK